MSLEQHRRLVWVRLQCDACWSAVSIEVPPAMSESDAVWEAVRRAKEEGWKVVVRENDVFALCDACVDDLLGQILMEFYNSNSGHTNRGGRCSARRPAEVRSSAGLWRRVVEILPVPFGVFRREVDHGEE